ncbi:hypothetical protein JAAARDRAFT_143106 [Jaapia argillacea MUCL 33604]|uniref:Uncharacterized protein n=1 Tax=Jaapia argillacea MUCL 33604 TaxID=933084 RepID=A0A067PF40_9AGAM|nr:hypothetical protein JAAARDRAFT_143106 [Jaapia argillacea MUCL 33604]
MHKQGVARRPPRVKLSAEARKVLKIRRKTTAMSYQEELDNAWGEIEAIKDRLAAKYSKSRARVGMDIHGGRGSLSKGRRNKTSAWNAFVWKMRQTAGESAPQGRGVLTDITQDPDFRTRYEATSQEERESYIAELEQHKATNAKAQRISTRSKTNDVVHTVAAIEDELVNLGLHTGIEAMLVVVKGSTNMTTKPRMFTTERIENFLAGTLKIDPGDFVTRMEGCALGGLKGAANHKHRLSSARSFLRELINSKLIEITNDTAASMKWTQYWRDIVVKYRVVIHGWPDDIPFGNLSDVVKTLHEYESLTRKWQKGKITFRTLTEQEFAAMDEKRQQQVENGEIDEPALRKTRSDKGRKRTRSGNRNEGSRKKKASNSRDTVDTDSDPSDGESRELNRVANTESAIEGVMQSCVGDGENHSEAGDNVGLQMGAGGSGSPAVNDHVDARAGAGGEA